MTSVQALTRYLLWIGTVGFGGPVALVARMQRELVDERRWFTVEEFQDAVALAQIAPGPLAAQVAAYLGWLRGGARGSALAATAFVLPSFAMVAGLSTLYLRFGGMPALRAAFYGVGAVVVTLLARGALRLLKKAAQPSRALLAVAVINGVTVAFTGVEYVSLLVLTGCAPMLIEWVRRNRAGAMAVAAPFTVAAPSFTDLFLFFAKSSLVVFGSGLAILPYLRAEVVERHAWITEPQFLDAVAVSMLTPGPVVITVTFIGWLAAGPLGGVAATLGVFTPTVLVVVLTAPLFKRFREHRYVRLAAEGITAAASGALAGAVVVIGTRSVTDWATAALALATLAVVTRFPRVPEPALILAGAFIGFVLR